MRLVTIAFLILSACAKSSDSKSTPSLVGTYVDDSVNMCSTKSQALLLTISESSTLTLADTQFSRANCTGNKTVNVTSPETSYAIAFQNNDRLILEVFTKDKIYWAVKLDTNGMKMKSFKSYDEANTFLTKDWDNESVTTYSKFGAQ